MGMPRYLENKFNQFLNNEPVQIFRYGIDFNAYQFKRQYVFNPMSCLKWIWKQNNYLKDNYKSCDSIYFIQNTKTKLVKIGFTSRPVSDRKSEIERKFFNGIRLNVLGTIHGTLEDEKRLHVYFHKQRVYDEWFEPNKEMKKIIILTKYKNSTKKIFDILLRVNLNNNGSTNKDDNIIKKIEAPPPVFDFKNYDGKTDQYILYVFDNWNKITTEKISLRNLAREVKKILPARMRKKGGGYGTCSKVLKKYDRKY